VTAFVYESERYVSEKIQILGVSVEPPEEGKKFLERVTRDCKEDRPHIPLDPYPLRLLSDPEGNLIRAAGVENEGHRAGLISHPVTFVVDRAGIVRWIYAGDSASDRPSPVALAKTAVDVARGKEIPPE
jgi:peroxiredoxin